MSKMKHLLRKLHIGGGFNDHNNRLAATDTPSQSPATTQFHSSSSPTPLPTIGTVDSLAVVNDSSAVDFNFFEEEFQMQLALAIRGLLTQPDAGQCDVKDAFQSMMSTNLS